MGELGRTFGFDEGGTRKQKLVQSGPGLGGGG